MSSPIYRAHLGGLAMPCRLWKFRRRDDPLTNWLAYRIFSLRAEGLGLRRCGPFTRAS